MGSARRSQGGEVDGRGEVLAFAVLAGVIFGRLVYDGGGLSEQSVVALVKGDGLRDHGSGKLLGAGLTGGLEISGVALGSDRELLRTKHKKSFLVSYEIPQLEIILTG